MHVTEAAKNLLVGVNIGGRKHLRTGCQMSLQIQRWGIVKQRQADKWQKTSFGQLWKSTEHGLSIKSGKESGDSRSCSGLKTRELGGLHLTAKVTLKDWGGLSPVFDRGKWARKLFSVKTQQVVAPVIRSYLLCGCLILVFINPINEAAGRSRWRPAGPGIVLLPSY